MFAPNDLYLSFQSTPALQNSSYAVSPIAQTLKDTPESDGDCDTTDCHNDSALSGISPSPHVEVIIRVLLWLASVAGSNPSISYTLGTNP